MSEAATAPVEAPASPAPVNTDLTGQSTPAAAADGNVSSPASGEGEGAAAPGQGAAGEAPNGGDPVGSETPPSAEGGDAQGAPEQYAAFTTPDGFGLSGEALEQVTSFAKAHNLNQAQAQALVDLGVQQADRIAADFTRQAGEKPVVAAEHWGRTWSGQTTADAEIGGANLAETMALASRVYQTFGTPQLGEFLAQTGLNHHPEIIRFMQKVGKAVSEDVLVVPNGQPKPKAPRGENAAKVLYPNMA